MILNIKNNKLLNIAFIGILILASCEKVVFFEVETKENKLVVNGFVQPDSAGNLTVSLSADPLAVGFEDERVETAAIYIYKNDVLAGNFVHLGDGNYFIDASTLSANAGDKLRIEASAPERESVSAETTIPSTVALEEVTIIDTIIVHVSYSAIDSLGNIYVLDTIVPHYKIQLKFTDPPGTDYYSLKINYKDAFSESFTCFTSDDPTFTLDGEFGVGSSNEDGTITLCDEIFFTDITFQGKQKTMTLSLLEIPTDFFVDPRFVFRLNHVSEDYYKYISSASLQASNGDNPFGEPVVVYSNIFKGFGIFAGLNSSIVELHL